MSEDGRTGDELKNREGTGARGLGLSDTAATVFEVIHERWALICA
jgi:hypothetical protein